MKKFVLSVMALTVCAGLQAKDYVLDVRTPGEIEDTGKIPGALVADFRSSTFKSVIEGYKFDPKSDTIAVYCRSGRRAGQVIEILKEYGFPDGALKNLGGYRDAAKTLNVPLVK